MQLKLVVQVHNYAHTKNGKLSIITRTNRCHSKANKCRKYIIYVRENRRGNKKNIQKTKQNTRNAENDHSCSYQLSIGK